jgi:hypothetical protein
MWVYKDRSDWLRKPWLYVALPQLQQGERQKILKRNRDDGRVGRKNHKN